MQEKSTQPTGRPIEHYRGFNGFKSESPIQYSLRCCRDALIQATLDRHVESVAPSPFDPTKVKAFFAFDVTLAQKRGVVALIDRPGPGFFDPPPGYAFGLTLTTSQVRADPLMSNARLVWSYKERLVPPDFQIRTLQALGKSRAGLALSDIRRIVSASYPMWLDFIFAMTARGDVELGNLGQFTDGTRVYWRRATPRSSFFADTTATTVLVVDRTSANSS